MRIEIDHQNRVPCVGERSSEGDGGRGFRHSTLLVRHRDDPSHASIVEGGRRSVMTATFTWDLPMDSTAAAIARQHVRDAASTTNDVIDAELIASELVTNAWAHGRGTGAITMTITVTDDVMRLEVCSDSDGIPNQVASSDEAPEGRGLLLIEKLAINWGHDRRDSTLCVWADVQCP